MRLSQPACSLSRPRPARFRAFQTVLVIFGFLAVHTWAGELELIRQTTVAEEALTFAIGPAARFSQTVNGRTHQQTPITTYRDYQYVTYFDAERRVCIARRKLPEGSWEIIQFKDHRFASNDSHNTTVIGICVRDGTIHMAFDHHASRLNYRVSKLGAAHHPDAVQWNADLFGAVTHTLGSVQPNKQVTYPRFFPAPNGNLMLYYRAVTSADGDGMIEEYDGEKHDWTPGLGKFIARDIGTYTIAGKTSAYRCPYMNSLSYAGGRLHASWVWRDRFERTSASNQHDLCYAYSDDHGRTWRNSEGKVIGKTGTDPIHLNTPGLVVAPIPINSRLSNQNTHYACEDGSIHIVTIQSEEGRGRSCYHHHWRNSDGVWYAAALPFLGSRPKVVGAKDRSLILVYTDDDDRLRVALGKPDSDKSGWHWSNLALPGQHSCYGDAVLDLQRWEGEQVLSIYSQDKPVKEIRTSRPDPVDGFPSPLQVVDYRLIEKTRAAVSRWSRPGRSAGSPYFRSVVPGPTRATKRVSCTNTETFARLLCGGGCSWPASPIADDAAQGTSAPPEDDIALVHFSLIPPLHRPVHQAGVAAGRTDVYGVLRCVLILHRAAAPMRTGSFRAGCRSPLNNVAHHGHVGG